MSWKISSISSSVPVAYRLQGSSYVERKLKKDMDGRNGHLCIQSDSNHDSKIVCFVMCSDAELCY